MNYLKKEATPMYKILIRVYEDNDLRISEETAERLKQAARTILEREGVEVELTVMARHDHPDDANVI